MNTKIESCEFESRVAVSAQMEMWDPELGHHVKQCSSCTELVFTIRALHALAINTKELVPEPNLMKILLQSYVRESGRLKRLHNLVFKATLGICAIASSIGVALMATYGEALSGATKAIGNSLPVSNLGSTALPFCLLLVALFLAWMMAESELPER